MDYYGRLTDLNGPAMTHAMFAIGWLEVGEEKKAELAFKKNYANIQGPFKVENCFFLLDWASIAEAKVVYILPFSVKIEVLVWQNKS